jgi:hypothetical protein
MEERYEFAGAEVLALVEEAQQAEVRLMTEAQRLVAAGVDLQNGEIPEDPVDHPGTGAQPGLWLMNDRGVYLRSNARDGGERLAYAQGYNTDVAVGLEPFCEFVDAAPLDQLRPDDTLVVTLDKHKIRLSLLRPA